MHTDWQRHARADGCLVAVVAVAVVTGHESSDVLRWRGARRKCGQRRRECRRVHGEQIANGVRSSIHAVVVVVVVNGWRAIGEYTRWRFHAVTLLLLLLAVRGLQIKRNGQLQSFAIVVVAVVDDAHVTIDVVHDIVRLTVVNILDKIAATH